MDENREDNVEANIGFTIGFDWQALDSKLRLESALREARG